jgi:DNA-binding NarL/FixJ family response regulator
MSWYVEQLLLNSDKIRHRVSDFLTLDTDFYQDSYHDLDEAVDFVATGFDYDNDTYADLLSVEMKLKYLKENNLLSKTDIAIVENVLSGKTFKAIGLELNIYEVGVSNFFSNVCEKIGYLLGDHFTDDGYIDYLTIKYQLTDEQIEKLKSLLE